MSADAPLQDVFLLSGAIHCSADPSVVTTVLGSCVGVCLWDSVRQTGGMNHFVLPLSPDGDRTPRYGDVAIDRLVEAMVRHGSRTEDLTAKLFGGANVLPYDLGHDTVGTRNVQLALKQLHRHGIPVAARRTGGERGLLVKFHTQSGLAMVKPIEP